MHSSILVLENPMDRGDWQATGHGTAKSWAQLSTVHKLLECSTFKNCQSRFDAQYWMLGAGALGRPRGMVWGGRRDEGSGWGTHVYVWRIHFDIWQN